MKFEYNDTYQMVWLYFKITRHCEFKKKGYGGCTIIRLRKVDKSCLLFQQYCKQEGIVELVVRELEKMLGLKIKWRRGRDCMVVGFTTTFATSVYHHERCGFEYRSWRGVFDTTLCDKDWP